MPKGGEGLLVICYSLLGEREEVSGSWSAVIRKDEEVALPEGMGRPRPFMKSRAHG
jgi:hypothetical protein